jgi:metallo-beta-lactamase class B
MRRLLLTLLLAPLLHAQVTIRPEWTTPLPPFQIADNLYYVGSRDLAAYLITTPQGDILINANLSSSPPLIRHSVEQLGLHWSDIKILLIGHAHSDHAGGAAEILRETHAKYMVMDADVPAIQSGGATDLLYPKDRYPRAHVDRTLHDLDTVTLGVPEKGGVTLTAHKTPGHTPGCTAWTFTTHQHGIAKQVVIVGGATTIDYRLASTPGHPATYPTIAADFQHTFDILHALPCDIFLGAHGLYFDMLAKLARANPTDPEAVCDDPASYRTAIDRFEQAYLTTLHKQQQEK